MSETERDVTAVATDSVGVGDALRRARKARALSLEQVAIELRIEARQLHALEDERFGEIGPPVFVKGYLRHYCVLLGLDQGEMLARYQRQAGEAEVALQPSRTIRLHNERQITLWIVAALALLVVIALLYFWWRGEGLAFLDGAAGVRIEPGVASTAFASKLPD